MKNITKLVFISIIIATQWGCAASMRLAEDNALKIKTVETTISEDDLVGPQVNTRSERWAMAITGGVGGAIGATVGAAIYSDATTEEGQFWANVQAADIDPYAKLLTAANAKIADYGRYKLVHEHGSADATIKIQILQWGVGATDNPFSSAYKLFMTAQLFMHDKQGELIWTREVREQAETYSRPTAKLEEYLSNTSILKQHFKVLVDAVIDEAIEHLHD